MLLLEFHKWRGFDANRDLFFVTLVIGWVSLSINGQRVTDIISEYRKKLDELRRKLKQDDDSSGSTD